MKNLFICLTPLQSLIAQSLIRKTAPTPADLLMICYAETDNAKFRHYYQETAQLCQYAQLFAYHKIHGYAKLRCHSLLKIYQNNMIPFTPPA